jgi:hypothetical protein
MPLALTRKRLSGREAVGTSSPPSGGWRAGSTQHRTDALADSHQRRLDVSMGSHEHIERYTYRL